MKIPISEIEVINKDDLNETEIDDLTDSILHKGMMHPIIVHQVNNNYRLVAGRKRLEAVRRLGRSEIESTILEGEMTEDQLEEISLHENLKRFDLPWYEEVMAVERLHEIGQRKIGVADGVGRPTAPVWGVRDTADALQMSLGKVSQDINLARAVRQNPMLRNVKDKKTALRLIRIEVQRTDNENEAGISSIGEDYDQVLCGDSESVLKSFPSNTFHVCLTDPPWLKFYDESLRMDDRTLPVFTEVFRVLRHNSFMYMFVGDDDYTYYKEQLPKIGFKISKTFLIWKKLKSVSRRGVSPWEYERDFELILLAAKGSPVLTTPGLHSSFFEHEAVPPVSLIHPNEKPSSIGIEILRQCSYEGNVIVDPFAGSGSFLESAKKSKRKYIGIERDLASYHKIERRLAK